MDIKIGNNNQLVNLKVPEQAFDLTNKKYVDENLQAHAVDNFLHLTPGESDWLSAILVSAAEVNFLAGATSSIQTQLNNKLPLSGGAMTGNLSLFAAPSSPLHAVNKNYADLEFAKKLDLVGGVMTGFITLHDAPTNNLHAVTKKYVDDSLTSHTSDSTVHVTPSQRSFLDSLTVTSTEVNQLSGVTSSVQTQLNNRLPLSGGTLSGLLTLSDAPTLNLHAATKKYVDDGLITKLNTSGGTLTGVLTLNGAPTQDLHAATKKYVDDGMTGHSSDMSLHLTTAQNTWLDSITATSTEINRLTGLTENVQTGLDNKLNKAGGTFTGDLIASADVAIRVSRVPVDPSELTNKAYVDFRMEGKKWRNPILVSNLLSFSNNNPPLYPNPGDSYIVGPSPTGAWAGRNGYLVSWVNNVWVSIQNRRVAVGDRIGVAMLSGTGAGPLSGYEKGIITITTASIGNYQFTSDLIEESSTALVYDAEALDFGVTYTFDENGNWVITNTSVNFAPTGGLTLDGKILNVGQGRGILVYPGYIEASLATAGGLTFNEDDEIAIHLDGTTLQVSGTGIKLHDSLKNLLDRIMTYDGDNTVTGRIDVQPTGRLTTLFTPTAVEDVINKGYVDAANATLVSVINDLSDIVDVLNTDPVTKSYVNTELNKKLDSAGGSMTGFLTLHADPTNNLQAATKQYVDTNLGTHTSDNNIHVTSGQKTLLSAITSTAQELNYTGGVTSSIQSQLNNRLPLSGGTLTGALSLTGLPTVDAHAANKKYVDDNLLTKLSLSGGTMTGFIILHADPTNNYHPSTKKYVDDSIATHAANTTLHLTTTQKSWLDAISVNALEVNYLSGVTSNVQTQLASKLPLNGGTLTGMLTLYSDPTVGTHAANKQYVDNALSSKLSLSGGTMAGYLKLVGDPVSGDDAVPLSYLNTRITAANAYADSLVGGKLNTSGGTMTGFITLHADPTSNYHAATKKYVDDTISTLSTATSISVNALQNRATALETDVGVLKTDPVTKTYTDNLVTNKLNKNGDTATGFITLHADPTAPMHAATKQYVDATASGLSVKASVRLATTLPLSATYDNGSAGVNATLTATANGALVVDGKNAVLNDRILVRVQSFSKENGDYVVVQVGDAGTPFILRRNASMDEAAEINGGYFNVYDGNTLKATGWVLTVADPTTFVLGTHAITVNQFFGPGAYLAGAGMTISGNTFRVNSVSSSRIVVGNDDIDLAITGITAGTYTKVTVDAYGRAMAGENPTTLSGYGITDAQPLNTKLSTLSGLSTKGLLVIDSANNPATRLLQITGNGLSLNDDGAGASGTALIINSNATAANTPSTIVFRDASGNFVVNTITGNLSGTATLANALSTARNFSITGDVVAGTQSFDGSGNVILNANLANSGVTAGTYRSLTVNAKGIVTGASNPTTLSGYGITDAQPLNAKLTTLSAVATRGIVVIDNTDSAKVRKLTVTGAGIGINDNGTGDATADIIISSNATHLNTASTIVSRNASGNFAAGVITADLTGNASTATKLATARNFSITGDVTATAQSFDGSGHLVLTAALPDSGVTAGTYKSVSVNAKGVITGGTNPTTLAGYGITDAVTVSALTAEVNALKAQIAELYNYIHTKL